MGASCVRFHIFSLLGFQHTSLTSLGTKMVTKKQRRDPKEILDDLYSYFSPYEAGKKICDLCFSKAANDYFVQTPPRLFPSEWAVKLFNEAPSHWESNIIYRHHLPGILNLLARPESCRRIRPVKIFDVLIYMGYLEWPSREKILVREFLETVAEVIPFKTKEDSRKWATSITIL